MVETKGGQSIRLDGLSKRASSALHDAVQHDVEERSLDLAATKEAQAFRPEITALANAATRMLPAGRYIRQSQTERVVAATRGVTDRCTDRVRRKLDADTTAALQQIDEILEPVLPPSPGLAFRPRRRFSRRFATGRAKSCPRPHLRPPHPLHWYPFHWYGCHSYGMHSQWNGMYFNALHTNPFHTNG